VAKEYLRSDKMTSTKKHTMQRNEIKLGDIVRLASGGPVMTAIKYSDASESFIICCWWDGSKYVSSEFCRVGLIHATV
jgi:uncharacterized protein YodC (DUF2158 family)